MKFKDRLRKIFNKATIFIGLGAASIGYNSYDAIKTNSYEFNRQAKIETLAKAAEGERRAEMKAVVLWDEALAMKEAADRKTRVVGDLVGVLLGLQVLGIGGAAADERRKKKNPDGPAA